MRARLLQPDLAVLISFVGSIFVSACWATASIPPSPFCARIAASKPCGADPAMDSPEQLQSKRVDRARVRAFLVTEFRGLHCSSADEIATMSSYDTCIASIDAMLPQATAEAAARRTAAAPAVASLRADARYATGRETYRKAVILQSAACHRSEGATADKGCEYAASDVRAATAAMHGLFDEHQIDLRDVDALGLL